MRQAGPPGGVQVRQVDVLGSTFTRSPLQGLVPRAGPGDLGRAKRPELRGREEERGGEARGATRPVHAGPRATCGLSHRATLVWQDCELKELGSGSHQGPSDF